MVQRYLEEPVCIHCGWHDWEKVMHGAPMLEIDRESARNASRRDIKHKRTKDATKKHCPYPAVPMRVGGGSIANLLRDIRRATNIPQRVMADIANSTHGSISMYERGQMNPPGHVVAVYAKLKRDTEVLNDRNQEQS